MEHKRGRRLWGPGRWLAVFLLLAWVLAPGPGLAGQIVGKPRAITAGTLDFSSRVVRLYGIDAPEVGQTCRAATGLWACGQEARWAAINRFSPHWVTCVEAGRAADGATVAVCYLAGVGQHDLGAWLVAHGWALADRRVSQEYVDEEEAAQAARAGMWRGQFLAPGDWRKGARLPQ